MIRRLIACAALALVCRGWALSAEQGVDFDQGVNVSAVLDQAQQAVRPPLPPPHPGQPLPPHQPPMPYPGPYPNPGPGGPAFSRWDDDCVNFTFTPDDPLRSPQATLESRLYEQRCYPIPNGGQNCHEEWVRTERARVDLQIVGRGKMLPWERDIFRVCLSGYWLNARALAASYEYDIRLPSYNDGTIEARAGRKIAQDPDPSGVYLDAFRLADGNYELALKDRWAEAYKGERVGFTLELKKHRTLWFDDTLLTKDIDAPAAEAYAFKFADYASEFKQKLEPGQEYYARWRFKRVGALSKDSWQGFWKTDKIKFAQGATLSVASIDAADKSTTVCWLRGIEKDQCVYKCRDGRTIQQPISQPDPSDPDGSTNMPCPQILIPMGK